MLDVKCFICILKGAIGQRLLGWNVHFGHSVQMTFTWKVELSDFQECLVCTLIKQVSNLTRSPRVNGVSKIEEVSLQNNFFSDFSLISMKFLLWYSESQENGASADIFFVFLSSFPDWLFVSVSSKTPRQVRYLRICRSSVGKSVEWLGISAIIVDRRMRIIWSITSHLAATGEVKSQYPSPWSDKWNATFQFLPPFRVTSTVF